MHLYLEDRVDFEVDDRALTGGVTVVDIDPPANPPNSPADWRHFGFVLDAADVFPGTRFDASQLKTWAPHGRVMLTGGTLSGGVPVTQFGDRPWTWKDQSGTPFKQSFLTDRVVFEVEFQTKVSVISTDGGGTDRTDMFPTGDCSAWVVHDPFATSRRSVRVDHLEHLDMFRPLFVGAAAAPTIKAAPVATPKTGTCASMQVKKP